MRCDHCQADRPDDKTPVVHRKALTGTLTVESFAYCSDRRECRKAARRWVAGR